MHEALNLYLQLGNSFGGVKAGNMFGWRCFKYRNKPFIFFDEASQQAMVFKLDAINLTEILTLEDTHIFNPGEKGKPMKNWAVVPYQHHHRWPELAELAYLNLLNALEYGK